MKHISRVSGRPAIAADAGPLTNFNKPTPGLLGWNEIGDVPIQIATIVDNLPVAGAFWSILPTGVSKSGDGNFD